MIEPVPAKGDTMARFLFAQAVVGVRDDAVTVRAIPQGADVLCTLKWTGDLARHIAQALHGRSEGEFNSAEKQAAFTLFLDPDLDDRRSAALELIEEVLLTLTPRWVPVWTLAYQTDQSSQFEIRASCSQRDPRQHRRFAICLANTEAGHLQWLRHELLGTPDLCMPTWCWEDGGKVVLDVVDPRAKVWVRTAETIAGAVDKLLSSTTT